MSARVISAQGVKLSFSDGVTVEVREGAAVWLVLCSMGIKIPRAITLDQTRELARVLNQAADTAEKHGR